MYDFFNKNGITIFTVLGAVLALVTVIMIAAADESQYNEVIRYTTATNFGLRSIYVIGISCAVLAVGLPIYNSVSEPKKLLKPVIGIVAIGIVFLICLALASSEFDVAKFGPETSFDLSPATARVVGGMLITMYALVLIAIVGILVTELMKFFK